jgi:hypothetical protein
MQVPDFGEGTFCSWLKLQVPDSVEVLGFVNIPVYTLYIIYIYIDFAGFPFCREKSWNMCFHIL